MLPDIFEHNDRTFTLRIEYDTLMGPPWEEHDFHGPVREERQGDICHPSKRAGERVMHHDGRYWWFYDWQEATRIAKRDGWGISREERIAFAWKHWRCPTNKEVVRIALQRDFDYLRRWTSDQWHWVYIVVECDDRIHGKVGRSVGGYESDCDDFLMMAARGLADEINNELDLLDASYYEDEARIQEYARSDMYGGW